MIYVFKRTIRAGEFFVSTNKLFGKNLLYFYGLLIMVSRKRFQQII